MQLFLPLNAKLFKIHFTEDRKLSLWNSLVEKNTIEIAKTLHYYYFFCLFISFSQHFVFRSTITLHEMHSSFQVTEINKNAIHNLLA